MDKRDKLPSPAAITRQPGGVVEYINANFTGSTNTQKMYGADTVNCAFEFDGTTYVPIHTGMAADAPTHVMFHRFSLFLSFLGSVQYSGLGAPYAWTVVLGAEEWIRGTSCRRRRVRPPATGLLRFR